MVSSLDLAADGHGVPAELRQDRIADELEARGSADVAEARRTDVRPALVRQMWRRWDRVAGLGAAQVGAA